MADYQAFNYGTPQQLAERAAAWQGYGGFDMGAGSAMTPALRDFLNSKIYPTNNGPTPPPGKENDYEWRIQNGFTAVPSEFGMGWDYPSSNAATAGQYQQQMGAGAFTSPDGRYYAHQLRDGAGYMIDDLSRGANEPTMGYYDPTGNFTRAELGAKNMTNWQGVLSVVGAALGFNAIGAAAAGGGAAAGAGGTAAGTGISYTAAGAPVFGIVDTGAAAASAAGVAGAAGAGISYTASGAPIFGVVDTGAAYGPGITYGAGGAPVFGAVDQGAAQASRAALAAQGGGAGAAAGGSGGGGTTGSGATTTAAAKTGAQTLGASAVKDKLVGSLVSAGASSLLGSLFSPKPDMSAPTVAAPAEPRPADTKTKAVSEMPDPLAQTRARKRSLVEQLGRRGRASTILTSPSGRLGS